MRIDGRAAEIVTRVREARESGKGFDVRAACEGDADLMRAVAARMAIQKLLDASFAGARQEALASQAPPVEPGQRVGTYRVVSRIGQGGMGTVFLALAEEAEEGLPLGTRVALKVLHPHLLGRGGYQDRFRREVKAGLRLHHPNVVPTLGAGRIAGPFGETIYLAMRYEEGRTLREFVAGMGTVPDPLVLEIARQVAAGLEAIHAAEVVHRDLKPENILLTDDQRVLIMDLGVARLLDDSLTLTRDGQFAGSILYAAPEQFRDEEAGPAADLYALGLTLYELRAGRHPFAGRTMAAVMQAHLSEEPLPIASQAQQVSPFLGAVVMTLLSKSPEHRFASAAELRGVLEQGTSSAWWKAYQRKETSKSPDAPPAIRVRRTTALHGRGEVFHTLWQAWQDAREGRGSVVFVVGEDGIGKTRLIDALARAAASGETRVLYGGYAPGSEHGGIADALLEHLGRRDLDSALTSHLRQTPRLTPHMAAWIRREAPPRDDTPLTSDALHAAVARVLLALAAERPVLWALDDVHHATADGRALLGSLARATEGAPILLVVGLRDGPERAELADLARLRQVRSIPLERLDEADVAEMVGDVLGRGALAERIAHLVTDRSGGVPYFVVELLRGLVESGHVTQGSDGSFEERIPIQSLAIPDALKTLLLGRLHALGSEERSLVDLAAVQGYRFDPRVIATACNTPPVAALRSFAAIERRDGIVRSDERGHRFDHRLLQEVVYAELPPELRAAYHTRLAEARAAEAGEAPEGEAAYFLARHHLAGQQWDAAASAILPALHHLNGQCRFSDAADLATRALAQPGLLAGGGRVSVLLAQASALSSLYLSPGRQAALAEAWQIAQQTDDQDLRTRAGVALAQCLRTSDDVREARAVIEPLLEASVAEGDERREAAATHALGTCAWSEGLIDEAWALFSRSRELSRELGDGKLEQRACIALSRIQIRHNQMDDAAQGLERALRLAAQAGDRFAESSARLHLGIVRHRMGKPDEARRHLEQCLRIAQRIGHRGRESEALGSLGNVAFRSGDYESAHEHHHRDLTISREIGDAQGEIGATINVANVAAILGRRDEARARYQRALELAREHREPRAESVCLTNLAMLAYDGGYYATARAHYVAGIDLAQKTENVELEGRHQLNLAYLLGELGAWAEAERLVEKSAECLGDAEWQRFRAYVQFAKAQLHEWRGEEAAAEDAAEEAIRLHREHEDESGLAASLEWSARRQVARGDALGAAPILEEAWALARGRQAPDVCVLVAADRVLLATEHEAAARRVLADHGERARIATNIRARYTLGRALESDADLKEAARLVEHLAQHAPEEFRDSMREKNPLYRAVLAAAATVRSTGP